MDSNICKFIPTARAEKELVTLNFVYEKNSPRKSVLQQASYSVGIVTSGKGGFESAEVRCELEKGDIFFTLSAREYTVFNRESLEFIYISFTGSVVPRLLERIGISEEKLVIHGCENQLDFWESSLERAFSGNIDLVAQCVLYYTFSHMSRPGDFSASVEKDRDTVLEIKKYIDENFNDPDLSLTKIAGIFGYNSNYIGERFKKAVRIGIPLYITYTRLEYAAALIKEGFCVVSQIAESCGYRDALYFSKQFKRHHGICPSEMIEKRRNGTTT